MYVDARPRVNARLMLSADMYSNISERIVIILYLICYMFFFYNLITYSNKKNYILEGARASTGFSLLCVDVGYKQWSNDRPICA